MRDLTSIPVHPFFGLPVADVSPEQVFELLLHHPDDQPPLHIGYLNPHGCNLAESNASFRSDLQASDLNLCDGRGLQWGLGVLGTPVQHRWTPPNHIHDLFREAEQLGRSLFFFGEREEDLEVLVAKLTQMYPRLKVAGTHHGFVTPENDAETVIALLQQASPDMILLGMGMPLQERWGITLKNRLDHGALFSGGALFLYVAGVEKRCPMLFSKLGLEWLYRLCRNPVKYWKRYVVGNLRFVRKVFREKARMRKSSPPSP